MTNNSKNDIKVVPYKEVDKKKRYSIITQIEK